MANKEPHLQASVLDRLIDRQPEASGEPAQYRFVSLAELKRSVLRDLENMLNTRRIIVDPPPSFVEVQKSLFTYGLKDITSYNPSSRSGLQQLRLEVERAIRIFEPRLRNVVVQMDTTHMTKRSIRFRVSAYLVVEPIKEPIVFDTVLDVQQGQYHVSG